MRGSGKDGKSDFDRLHSGANDASVLLYGFDLIELDGEDLRPAPLERRKGKLEKLLAPSDGRLCWCVVGFRRERAPT